MATVSINVYQLPDIALTAFYSDGTRLRIDYSVLNVAAVWKSLAGAVYGQLPPYALPLFVRVVKELAQTTTFKSRKVELREQAYGSDVKDPLYVLAGRDEGYVPFYDDYPGEVADEELVVPEVAVHQLDPELLSAAKRRRGRAIQARRQPSQLQVLPGDFFGPRLHVLVL